jgi:hypothetical protein
MEPEGARRKNQPLSWELSSIFENGRKVNSRLVSGSIYLDIAGTP